MSSAQSAHDLCTSDVHFYSCDALVPFKNPSDAAIARLASEKGFTLGEVQSVLDLLVFNVSFDPREVTFKSADDIDETVAEFRRVQTFQRASSGNSRTSENGGPSALVLSLVMSQIAQGIVPFSQEIVSVGQHRDGEAMLLKNMSLVHRSWTESAQELLFRRVRLTGQCRSQGLRRLLQNPFCSRIREVHYDMNDVNDNEIDLFTALLRRLTSLRNLSLRVSGVRSRTRDAPSHGDRYSRIYSEIARCLPNLEGLWLNQLYLNNLEYCVKSILQGRLDAVPFTLKVLSISCDFGTERAEILFSPAILQSLVRHEVKPEGHFYFSDDQVPNLGSGDTPPCSFLMYFGERYFFRRLFGGLFDHYMRSAVLGNIHPRIHRLTLRYPFSGTLDDYSYYDAFDAYDSSSNIARTDSDAQIFLECFLENCTSLTRMDLFIPKHSDQGMFTLPTSSFPSTLKMLCVYFAEPGSVDKFVPGFGYRVQTRKDELKPVWEKKRARGLEHIVKDLCVRPGGSALERIEVTFCLGLDEHIEEVGLDVTLRHDLKCASHETSPPEFLSSLCETCLAHRISLVLLEADLREPKPDCDVFDDGAHECECCLAGDDYSSDASAESEFGYY